MGRIPVAKGSGGHKNGVPTTKLLETFWHNSLLWTCLEDQYLKVLFVVGTTSLVRKAQLRPESVTEHAFDRWWRRMCIEEDTYQTVDGKGAPFVAGGISAVLRDLARLGLRMLNFRSDQRLTFGLCQSAANTRLGRDYSEFCGGFPTFKPGSDASQ